MLFTFPSRYSSTIGLSGVFSLGGWCRRIRRGFLRSPPTQDTTSGSKSYVYGILTLYDRPSQTVRLASLPTRVVLQPRSCRDMAGLGSSAFARHYLRNHCYFLLLWVLRCFSSPRSPPLRDDHSSSGRVAPFGHPRIAMCVPFPADFRSLPRPSSPLRA